MKRPVVYRTTLFRTNTVAMMRGVSCPLGNLKGDKKRSKRKDDKAQCRCDDGVEHRLGAGLAEVKKAPTEPDVRAVQQARCHKCEGNRNERNDPQRRFKIVPEVIRLLPVHEQPRPTVWRWFRPSLSCNGPELWRALGRQQLQRVPRDHQLFICRDDVDRNAAVFLRDQRRSLVIRSCVETYPEPGEPLGDTCAHCRRVFADPGRENEGTETPEGS